MNEAIGKPVKRGRGRTRTKIPPVRALERGLLVLEAMGEGGDIALSEIARATSLSCSTTFRIIETLSQRGYALQDEESGRYRIGPSALRIGAAYSNNSPLPSSADASMQTLVKAINETANLAILDNELAVYIHQVQSQHSVRMFTQLGAHVPLYCTGVGKALLAWQPEEELSRVLKKLSFEAFTSNTITDLGKLQKELKRVRKMGYAVDDEERELGVRCITAPVRSARGLVVAALSISAPVSRFPKRIMAQRSEEVINAADKISKSLGYLG